MSTWAPSRSAGGRISHRAIPVPARPTTIASSGMVSQMSLMSFVLIESLPLYPCLSRTDTQKSILYACPGSPKSHRVSHCGKSERRRRLLMATSNASPSSSPSPSRCATQCWHAGERASGGAASALDAGTAAAQPSCLLSAGDEGALEQREVAQWQQLDRLRVTDHTTAVLTASRPGRSAQPDDDDDAGGASGEH